MKCFPLLLLVLCSFLCSFSAVPIQQTLPQKKNTVKTKRQLKQKKHQQKRLERQQFRASKRLQKPSKNHARFNIAGFVVIISGLGAFLLGALIISSILNLSGLGAGILLVLLGGFCAITLLVGAVFCIIGLVGSQEVDHSKRGFGLAGLAIVGSILLFFLAFAFLAYL